MNYDPLDYDPRDCDPSEDQIAEENLDTAKELLLDSCKKCIAEVKELCSWHPGILDPNFVDIPKDWDGTPEQWMAEVLLETLIDRIDLVKVG